jgi:hypothetical protein
MQQDDIDPRAQKARLKELQQLEQLEAESEAKDVYWLMSDRGGRRIMYRLLERAGVYTGSFTGEALGTVYGEGKRAVGLAYLDILSRYCAEEYVLMLKEHQEDVDRNARN